MTNENSKNSLVRVNINIPEHLLLDIKNFATTMGLNTTSAINVLLKRALEETEVISKLPDMMTAIAELQKKALEDKKN